MNHLLSILLTAILCSTASAQTIKTLGYNATNGRVVANTGTNVLTFTNSIKVFSDLLLSDGYIDGGGFGGQIDFEENELFTGDGDWKFEGSGIEGAGAIAFNNTTNAATTRANLGFSTNLNTLWTATNTSSVYSALGLELLPDENGPQIGSAEVLWDYANGVIGFRAIDGDFQTSSQFIHTNGPANTTNVFRWLTLGEGTNVYKIPVYK
jgi:hypothetical protein